MTVAISSSRAEARITPTRSMTQSTGAKEETAMRSVALDLGVKETSFCEVSCGLEPDDCAECRADRRRRIRFGHR